MSPRQDAVDLLKAGDQEVVSLFEAFTWLCARDASDKEKSAVAEEICLLLSVAAQLKEEVFYPAVRNAISDDVLIGEATLQVARVKHLIAQVSVKTPSDPRYDDKVDLLSSAVAQGVKHEQGELFAKVRKTNIDLMALGAQLQDRKSELLANYRHTLDRSGPPEDEAADPVGRPALDRSPNKIR